MAPSALVYDEHVSGDALRLWAILDDLARAAPAAPAFVAQLAAVMRCSTRTIRRLRGELEQAGWLAVHGDDGGRGVPPMWQPLNRARPVDNGLESRSDLAAFSGANPATADRLSRGLPISPAREENEQPRSSAITAAQTAAACRPRCGRCDETRHIEAIEDGRTVALRCPVCHPLRPRF